MTSHIWVKLVDPETPWAEISLQHVRHVDGLKDAIKLKFPNLLQNYDAVNLILKAKRNEETDEQAIGLGNPEESIEDVKQRFGDVFRVLVSVPETPSIPG
jgi:hypothetical protein